MVPTHRRSKFPNMTKSSKTDEKSGAPINFKNFRSVNVSVDSHDIVDMDIDEEDIRNEFLKTLELTPLTLDFDNMDISKSTDLNSTCDNDIPKPAIISNVEMLSDLFQERYALRRNRLLFCINLFLQEFIKFFLWLTVSSSKHRLIHVPKFH